MIEVQPASDSILYTLADMINSHVRDSGEWEIFDEPKKKKTEIEKPDGKSDEIVKPGQFLELPLTEPELEQLRIYKFDKIRKIMVARIDKKCMEISIIKFYGSALSNSLLSRNIFDIPSGSVSDPEQRFNCIVDTIIDYSNRAEIKNLLSDQAEVFLAIVIKICFYQKSLDEALVRKNFVYGDKGFIGKYLCDLNLLNFLQEKFDKHPSARIRVEITVKPSICSYTAIFTSSMGLSCYILLDEVLNVLLCDRQVPHKPIIDTMLYLYKPSSGSHEYEVFRQFLLEDEKKPDRYSEIVSLKGIIELLNSYSENCQNMSSESYREFNRKIHNKLSIIGDTPSSSTNCDAPDASIKEFLIWRAARILAAFIIGALTKNYLIFCRNSSLDSKPEIIIGIKYEVLLFNKDYVLFLQRSLYDIADVYWSSLCLAERSYKQPIFHFTACEDEVNLGAALLCLVKEMKRN